MDPRSHPTSARTLLLGVKRLIRSRDSSNEDGNQSSVLQPIPSFNIPDSTVVKRRNICVGQENLSPGFIVSNQQTPDSVVSSVGHRSLLQPLASQTNVLRDSPPPQKPSNFVVDVTSNRSSRASFTDLKRMSRCVGLRTVGGSNNSPCSVSISLNSGITLEENNTPTAKNMEGAAALSDITNASSVKCRIRGRNIEKIIPSPMCGKNVFHNSSESLADLNSVETPKALHVSLGDVNDNINDRQFSVSLLFLDFHAKLLGLGTRFFEVKVSGFYMKDLTRIPYPDPCHVRWTRHISIMYDLFCAAAESKYANSKKDQHTIAISSTTTSTAQSSTSTSKLEEELKIASRLRKFAFNDLKMATRNFRPDSLLGEGGFGCVFKGWIEENGTAPVKPGTGLTVAVKTLNHDGLQGHKEWLAEVSFLGDLIHPNLVKLIGYCIEDDQRLLVYEFMSRGSLENHLFRSIVSKRLISDRLNLS
ncbi:hypothetical protein AgCh_018669 [Apium graveolens]